MAEIRPTDIVADALPFAGSSLTVCKLPLPLHRFGCSCRPRSQCSCR